MRARVALYVPGADGALPDQGSTAVVIDVLRATTTLTVALGNGATGVTPAASPEEAMGLRERHPRALLGGEREGRKLPGFDLGNSPFEYTREVVGGRRLIFASTNGSLALRAAARARRRVLCAFVNLEAVVERVRGESDIRIVASGKLGAFSIEDAGCAGLLCERLVGLGARLEDAGARMAASLAPRGAADTRALVEGSAHGRYLRSLGPDFARDVELCAGLDTMDRAFEV